MLWQNYPQCDKKQAVSWINQISLEKQTQAFDGAKGSTIRQET